MRSCMIWIFLKNVGIIKISVAPIDYSIIRLFFSSPTPVEHNNITSWIIGWDQTACVQVHCSLCPFVNAQYKLSRKNRETIRIRDNLWWWEMLTKIFRTGCTPFIYSRQREQIIRRKDDGFVIERRCYARYTYCRGSVCYGRWRSLRRSWYKTGSRRLTFSATAQNETQ